MKVMVVEDEVDIREILKNLLEEEGFQVIALADGQNIIDHIQSNNPDVLLLDQILPGKTGVEALREVRASLEFSKLPVIMVTGISGEDDRVNALDVGADDYVTKPFYPKELAARVKALMRRSIDLNRTEEKSKNPHTDRLQIGAVAIELFAHRASVEGQEVQLTLTEFNILKELLQQSDHVLTRQKLRERALGNLNVSDRTIDVHMASLRKKLGTHGGCIQTVRGMGYRFCENIE